MAQHQHRHQHIFGDRRLVSKGIADHHPGRQRGLVNQLDAGGHRLHQPQPWRRRVFRAPVIGDEDLGIGRDLWRPQQRLRLDDDLDPQTKRQPGLDAIGRVGGDIAEKQRLHSGPRGDQRGRT